MSCYGSRTTPLFEVKLDHVVDYDDWGGPPNPFSTKINFFARIWTFEFELSFHPDRDRKSWTDISKTLEYHHLGIPRVGFFEWRGESLPARQYSGDYTENMDEYRYAPE